MEIKGHLALVTGGGRRIGAACVRALSAAGVRVAVHCHGSTELAENLCREIHASGGVAWTIAADLSDWRAVEALLPRVEENGGPVTILVNNAAIFEPDTVLGANWDDWNRHMALNLAAPFFLMSRFARQVPEGATGKVVNILDQRVMRPGKGYVSYTVAKSGLLSLTRMAALELAPNIQVNAIGPGAILPAAGGDTETFMQLSRSVPMGRPGSTDDITEALLFFLRQDYITGEMLCVDGGQHL
ncbi:MAG: SDR family oxidoreductase [Magnetococcales bacterium]|nr:SDR family oxidoreductase [Magnetococcales bacterium]